MTTNPVSTPAVHDFADALNDLARHAAAMDSGGNDATVHEDCIYCQTTILLSRVVGFGNQLRGANRS